MIFSTQHLYDLCTVCLKSQRVAVFQEPSHGADNWPVIDHLPSSSPPAPLLFFPPSLFFKDAKAQACVCVLVCVCVLLATMPVIQGVLVGGFKRRGGRAGLPVFVSSSHKRRSQTRKRGEASPLQGISPSPPPFTPLNSPPPCPPPSPYGSHIRIRGCRFLIRLRDAAAC